MNENVIDLDVVRDARRVAAIIERTFGSELDRAKRNGCKLLVKVDEVEQIGRGTLFKARARLTPDTNNMKTRFARAAGDSVKGTATAIEGQVDYIDPRDADEAMKDAIDEAFRLAVDAGVFR